VTKVLVVGHGGREHALAWKLGMSPKVETVFIAPGNPGTEMVGVNVPIAVTDRAGLLRFVEDHEVGLTVIGPEVALEAGVQDLLCAAGHRVVGPSGLAFRLESSKAFAKRVMDAAGVPTARWKSFTKIERAVEYVGSCNSAVVVKADGLAAGKGVRVCLTADEALAALDDLMVRGRFGAAGRSVVIEELLEGPEISLMCLVDGQRTLPLPVAQDHKRLLDGNLGPNTGGMGAYAPVSFANGSIVNELVRETVTPVVAELAKMGCPFRGVLFAGLLLSAEGPRVLEYNCRFGDPETQAVLPLIEDDLFCLLESVADGNLPDAIKIDSGSTVAVVLAAGGYPESPEVGATIYGLSEPGDSSLLFHAGTSRDASGQVTVSGGRALTVVGLGASVAEAARMAYSSPVRFAGMHRRMDIGAEPKVLSSGIAGMPSEGRRDQGPRDDRIRLVVLASGGGTNLQALIDGSQSGSLSAAVVGVVSQDVESGALERARKARIPFAYVPLANRRDAEERRAHEVALRETITSFSPDVVVLAGWMLVLSADLIAELDQPIINVHPALLSVENEPLDIPILRGMRAVRDALALRLPFTGVSVHHVTPAVDAGPVILREAVEILPGDDEKRLHARLKLVEHRLLIESLNQIASQISRTPGRLEKHAAGLKARRARVLAPAANTQV